MTEEKEESREAFAKPVIQDNGRWGAEIDGVEYPVAQDFKHQEDIEFHCQEINAAHRHAVARAVEDAERKAAAKALEYVTARLGGFRDWEYCLGSEIAKEYVTKGWEQKVKTGVFGKIEMDRHKDMNMAFGRHFGLAKAIEEVRALADRVREKGLEGL